MRLHHLALRVANIDQTVTYYRDTFGLEVIRDERPRALWLELADGSLIMLETRGADEPGIPSGSKELVAFEVDAETKSRIRQRALDTGCFDGDTEHTVYLRDPDGRRLAVSTYPLKRPNTRP